MELKLYNDIGDRGYMKDHVYEVLRKNIMEFNLKPGTSLKKEDIAQKLEVSIMPIREAFTKLSDEGLLNVYPQSGTYVSHLNLEKVAQAVFMREQLEDAVVRLACQNYPRDYYFKSKANLKMQEIYAMKGDYAQLLGLDNDFHRILFQGCNKGDLWVVIEQFSTDLDRLRILRLAEDIGQDAEYMLAEHQELLDAIKNQNGELAAEVMQRHLDHLNFDIDEILDKYLDLFE